MEIQNVRYWFQNSHYKSLIVFFLLLTSFPVYSQWREFNHFDSLRGINSPFRKCYDVNYYDLNLAIVPEDKFLNGHNHIHYTAVSDFDTLQLDLNDDFIIDSLKYNGEMIRYRTDSNTIYVIFDNNRQKKGDKGIISVYYGGYAPVAPKPPWDGGFDFNTDQFGRQWTGVACEGDGASMWWPCKDHLSDEPDSMSMHFTVPRPLECISNGQRTGVSNHKDFRTFHYKVTYPINTYNVTVNIGHYVSRKWENRNGGFHVLKYNESKAAAHFKQVDGILNAYEEFFGEYPFKRDGYHLVETPYWGMEHQSAIAYGNNYKNNIWGFDFIILHETAHEWWGNSVSVKDHGELWVHEAFATYMESLYLEKYKGLDSALLYMWTQRKLIKNEQPILGPLNVNYTEWPDADMYYKGTWMLQTVRKIYNDDSLWFRTIKDLYQKHKYGHIESEDVISYLDANCSYDLKPVFNFYLNKTEIPKLVYAHKQLTRKKSVLTYRWVNVPDDFHMPVYFKTGEDKGQRLDVSSKWKILSLKKALNVSPVIHGLLVEGSKIEIPDSILK